MLGVAAAALGYILTPYASLARGYAHAFGPFYRQDSWTTAFFTPTTKLQGNAWCGLVIALSLGAAWWLVRTRPTIGRRVGQQTSFDFIGWVVVAAAGAFWLWANAALPIAYDEAFSALHATARPAGLAWSYYMLPNNHIFHNLLNATLFGWWAPDLMLTGRLLAGTAYVTTVAVAYAALRRGALSPVLAGLGALVVATQGPLWGFGAQNRGYALLALAHWGAALGVLAAIRHPAGRGAAACALGCAVGYAVLPSFLYFHAAILVFALGGQLTQRRLEARFWRWQTAAGLAVLIFYLPALAFSGVRAFTQNPYVGPTTASTGEFVRGALPVLPTYLDYGFPEFLTYPVGRWLLLLPVVLGTFGLLPALRRRLSALPAATVLYALALVALVVLVIGMRRLPFHRNLIGQLSLGLALLVAGVGSWANVHPPGGPSSASRPRTLIVGAALCALLGWQVATWSTQFPPRLYYTDVPAAAQTAQQVLHRLLPNARIAFSDESFYAAAFARAASLSLSPLPGVADSTADYYVSTLVETAPRWVRPARFVPVDTVAETVIWRRAW